jgi:hypothetical protein
LLECFSQFTHINNTNDWLNPRTTHNAMSSDGTTNAATGDEATVVVPEPLAVAQPVVEEVKEEKKEEGLEEEDDEGLGHERGFKKHPSESDNKVGCIQINNFPKQNNITPLFLKVGPNCPAGHANDPMYHRSTVCRRIIPSQEWKYQPVQGWKDQNGYIKIIERSTV